MTCERLFVFARRLPGPRKADSGPPLRRKDAFAGPGCQRSLARALELPQQMPIHYV